MLHPSEHDLRLFAGLAVFTAAILSVPTALASTRVVIIAVDQGDSEIAPAMAASGLAIGSAVALSVPKPELVLRDVPTEGPFHAAVIIRAIRVRVHELKTVVVGQIEGSIPWHKAPPWKTWVPDYAGRDRHGLITAAEPTPLKHRRSFSRRGRHTDSETAVLQLSIRA